MNIQHFPHERRKVFFDACLEFHNSFIFVAPMDKPQIIGHLHKSLNYTLFDCKWLPVSTKFVVVGSNPRDTGQIQIYDVTATELKLVIEVCATSLNTQSIKLDKYNHTLFYLGRKVEVIQMLYIWSLPPT